MESIHDLASYWRFISEHYPREEQGLIGTYPEADMLEAFCGLASGLGGGGSFCCRSRGVRIESLLFVFEARDVNNGPGQGGGIYKRRPPSDRTQLTHLAFVDGGDDGILRAIPKLTDMAAPRRPTSCNPSSSSPVVHRQRVTLPTLIPAPYPHVSSHVCLTTRLSRAMHSVGPTNTGKAY